MWNTYANGTVARLYVQKSVVFGKIHILYAFGTLLGTEDIATNMTDKIQL